ncbi:TRAP transporter small permease [Celerinatantimonas yamalensis]|uniref:TRAP transporter small permease protein n=1 Tax=Celerinatantimonas yamalensis TaxID=559956 RepID=A0ABW9G6P1_9GAMM
MNTIRQWLDRSIEIFCCFLTSIMVLVACWQVISRYIFNSPSTFSEEFLRFSLVWLSVIGLAYVAGKQEHISLTLFIDKCPVRLIAYWNMAIQVVFILFAAYILIIGGWHVSSNAMMQISPVLKLSMGKVYYALPLAGVITIIYCILNIIDMVKTNRIRKQKEGIQSIPLNGGRHD